MENNFQTPDRYLEDIYSQLKDIYMKLSQDNGGIRSYSNKNSLWEQFLPGVLIVKNIELLNKEMEELLKETTSEPMKENSKKSEPETSVQNDPKELAADIIKLRDQILLAKLSCSEAQKNMLSGLYEELGRILKANGIEELGSERVFNSQWHSIVDVKTTNIKGLDNLIAEITRPGYRLGEKVIRAQEVVVYKYE